MKEVKLKCFAGPFKELPFPNYIQSPIGLVPKGDDGRDTRLIFHISYPRNGNSVNSQTPHELCTVKYSDLDGAIEMCMTEGAGCYVAKSNMKSAFRNLPIKAAHWKWLLLYVIYPVTNQK